MRAFLIVVVLLAVPVLGMVLPRFIIGDDVSQYEGDERKMAEQALTEAQIFYAGDAKGLHLSVMHVSRVGTCREYPPDFDKPWFPVTAEVQLYTIFGIPDGELRMRCGEGTWCAENPTRENSPPECTQGQSAAVDEPHRTMVVCVQHTDKGVAWTYSNG